MGWDGMGWDGMGWDGYPNTPLLPPPAITLFKNIRQFVIKTYSRQCNVTFTCTSCGAVVTLPTGVATGASGW